MKNRARFHHTCKLCARFITKDREYCLRHEPKLDVPEAS